MGLNHSESMRPMSLVHGCEQVRDFSATKGNVAEVQNELRVVTLSVLQALLMQLLVVKVQGLLRCHLILRCLAALLPAEWVRREREREIAVPRTRGVRRGVRETLWAVWPLAGQAGRVATLENLTKLFESASRLSNFQLP